MDPKNQEPLIRHVLSKMSTYNAIIHKSTCNGTWHKESFCSVSRAFERKTYPSQNDLQQFLLQYSTSLCMCRADQVNIKKGLGLAGKPKDPR